MGALLTQARTYLGVPFKHRGRDLRGLDCAGLVWLSFSDLGVVLPDLKRYGKEPHRNGLVKAVKAALGEPVWTGSVGKAVPRSLLQIDDVVVLRFDIQPHHMAIVGDDRVHGLSIIHSYGQRGMLSASGNGYDEVGRVIEHGIDEDWLRKICAVYRRAV